ncbi:MFS transporter [Salinibacterium sp. SYSU T00001]|uniref:MFS transporter n=1 Tax=Homoserinimonas sedimenticola TaxID=2986805 RepID=UPI002235E4A8|nr:MFS transporter [Salinibacterium sedimenticola]MCW4384633.1 MFS transporter [Salinibacterium sedimenticola]
MSSGVRGRCEHRDAARGMIPSEGTREQSSRSHGGALEAFRVANFARYFVGQLVSNTGTWFQNLAISLIVVQVTGSASALALVTVAQFGPILLLAGVAGRLADTVSPRSILAATSACSIVVTCGLAVAVAQESPSLPWIYGLIVLSGCFHAFERVAAQAFIFELVGAELLRNAVVLSTVYISAARSIGPGLAGLAFLAVGPAACLLINAATYLAVLVAVLLIRPGDLHARIRPEGRGPSVRENLRAIRSNRALVVILVVNVVVTLAAMNMNVVLTSTVSLGFGGDAGELGAAHALNAVGAVVGGVLLARYARLGASTLVPACLLFSATLAVNAAAPSLLLFLFAAPLLGIGIGVYQGVLSGAAQGESEPHALGRTMSLVTLGQQGVAPLGALLVGVLIDVTSGQAALGVGAAVTACCGLAVYLALVRGRARTPERESGG